ncbi:MAG: hypothetical protein JOY76_09575, partial [Hyphomicrobiales bacterium]|nr:hypothetical protein [Hyphomicrobiales bacterium]
MNAGGRPAPAMEPSSGDSGDAAPSPKARRDDVLALRSEIVAKLTYSIGKDPIVARKHDWLVASILAVRDRIIDRWMASTREAFRTGR